MPIGLILMTENLNQQFSCLILNRTSTQAFHQSKTRITMSKGCKTLQPISGCKKIAQNGTNFRKVQFLSCF